MKETLHKNRVAEKFNRLLLEKMWCLLSNSRLSKTFWADALTYASHLIKRLPLSAIGGNTPMKMWSGNTSSDYDMFCVFGCLVYYYVSDGKLKPRARKDVFLGFKREVKRYKT